MLKTRILLGLFLIVGVLSSCKKELSAEKQATKDDTIILDFIAKNNIIAKKDNNSGLYYQIITEGTGAKPTISSSVSVKYVGKLLDGNVFDKSDAPVSFALNRLIVGWQIGIPLINKGGSIRLIVPSGLAYGTASPGLGIPKNSVLDFTIDLIDVN